MKHKQICHTGERMSQNSSENADWQNKQVKNKGSRSTNNTIAPLIKLM